MLIEPTETETKEILDQFIDAMITIADHSTSENIAALRSTPVHTPRRRLDETKAARNPILRWLQDTGPSPTKTAPLGAHWPLADSFSPTSLIALSMRADDFSESVFRPINSRAAIIVKSDAFERISSMILASA